MSAGHTPTPWSIDPNNGDIVSGPYNVTIPFACKDEDASFIVRAVNAHDELVEALNSPWSSPCPEGGAHCCCGCDNCCDCERPRAITPDWLNAETCIENVMIALDDATLSSEDGPIDTVVSSGDLLVILSLAGAALRARVALSKALGNDGGEG